MERFIAFFQTIVVLQFVCSVAESAENRAIEKDPATLCTSYACQLPDCLCAGSSVPMGLPKSSVPQFIMITFDGAINGLNVKRYETIFGEGRKNPDGCPIRGTFFVNHEWNDYSLTNYLYSQGHEIATHSITRESMKAFKEAGLDRWTKEIGGMKKILEIFAGIPAKDIKGFRAPFLHPGGDRMFEALNQSGLMYDSTLIASENDPPLWPYALEFKSSQRCQVGSCPRNSHPGIWEVPVLHQIDDSESPRVCSMIDSCQDKRTKDSALNMLVDNFMRHYTTNHAPFPLFMRTWFSGAEYRFEALLEFLEFVQLLPDVYVVPISDVIQWIQNPIPCELPSVSCPLKAMVEWSCRNKDVADRRPACPPEQKQNCNVKRKMGNALRDRRLTTCESCPGTFPWLGNPDGNLMAMRGQRIDESERPFWFPPRGVNLTKYVEKPVLDPFASFKKMDPRERVKMYLREKLQNAMADKGVLARVLGQLGG